VFRNPICPATLPIPYQKNDLIVGSNILHVLLSAVRKLGKSVEFMPLTDNVEIHGTLVEIIRK